MFLIFSLSSKVCFTLRPNKLQRRLPAAVMFQEVLVRAATDTSQLEGGRLEFWDMGQLGHGQHRGSHWTMEAKGAGARPLGGQGPRRPSPKPQPHPETCSPLHCTVKFKLNQLQGVKEIERLILPSSPQGRAKGQR